MRVAVLHWPADAAMRRQIDHLHLQWLGFKAPTSATPQRTSRGAQVTFRDVRNRCQVCVFTLEFVEIKSGSKLRPGVVRPSLRPEMSDLAPANSQVAEDAPGYANPSRRVAHSRRQAWQRPYSQPPLCLRVQAAVGCGSGWDRRLRRQYWRPPERGSQPQVRGPASASSVDMQVCCKARVAFQGHEHALGPCAPSTQH
jgi:hypothetical protein